MNDDAAKIAMQCRHYAMCKIDYLGTGLCPSGPARHFVAFFPQGRMDIFAALTKGLIPFSAGLVDVAETCTLCGICDRQCHFVTGMRPLGVMRALKERVAAHIASGAPVVMPPQDSLVEDMRKAIGQDNVSNDPAILAAYADDPFPLKPRQVPRCVVLPGSTADVIAVVGLANKYDVPYVVRGNGGSVFGMVFSPGIVIDMHRLREIEIDADNWTATVGAGVTAFELQSAAAARGLRINAAEPAATICGNIICTGLFSTWSATYGTAADNFIDMEFVDDAGRVWHLSDSDARNVFAYQHAEAVPPGICTRAMVRLHRRNEDEEGLLAPCASFESAIALAREIAERRLAIAIGVLGPHYLASFMSPDLELAERLERALPEALGIEYAVFAIADPHGRNAIRSLAGAVIDSDMLRTIMLGLPRLLDGGWLPLARAFEGRRPAYEVLCGDEMRPLLEVLLDPSPDTIASVVPDDLREFYRALYRRPEFSDAVWLNMFRIVSARMARHKHVLVFLVYVPMDRTGLIASMNAEFKRIGDTIGIDNSYGFLTPLDLGKRGVLEYDYYIDQTDGADRERAAAAMSQVVPWLDELALRETGVTWIKTFFSQGCARMESIIYRGFAERHP